MSPGFRDFPHSSDRAWARRVPAAAFPSRTCAGYACPRPTRTAPMPDPRRAHTLGDMPAELKAIMIAALERDLVASEAARKTGRTKR